jgi:hypothetical protein
VGSRLVNEAFAFSLTHPIADTDMRLLIWMCNRSLDQRSTSGQAPRQSFMRRSELALGLGRKMVDGRDEALERGDIKQWKADDQALTRCLKRLVDVGAVHRLASGRKGRTATYYLCLGAHCGVDRIALRAA